MTTYELIKINDRAHEDKNNILINWLNYNYSSAFIEYKLGLIDTFEYFKRGLYE